MPCVSARYLPSPPRRAGTPATAQQIAEAIGAADEVETVFKVLQHLSANKDRGVKRTAGPGKTVFEDKYSV